MMAAQDKGLLNQIREKRDSLSKGQKKLADYILTNYEKAAFMTALNLGQETGISESTVVRFAVIMGFRGYPEFQHALAALVQERLHSIERIEIAAGDMTQDMVLENVMNADAEKIKMTLEAMDRNAFESAVSAILKARTIYVVGVRSCAPLAAFFTFYLKMIFQNVVQVASSNASELFEQLIHVESQDVVIGISFPRYSMRTLKAMEFANNRNATVVSLTDSKHSPMNMYSSCNLFARSDMASIADSLVAPLSVINALIVALCLARKEDVIGNLETLEDIWDNYSFEENDEINLLDADLMADLRRMDE